MSTKGTFFLIKKALSTKIKTYLKNAFQAYCTKYHLLYNFPTKILFYFVVYIQYNHEYFFLTLVMFIVNVKVQSWVKYLLNTPSNESLYLDTVRKWHREIVWAPSFILSMSGKTSNRRPVNYLTSKEAPQPFRLDQQLAVIPIAGMFTEAIYQRELPYLDRDIFFHFRCKIAWG